MIASEPCMAIILRQGYILLPKPISSGAKAPHCTTLHTVCNSRSQKTIIASTTSRVKRGKRRRYDRTLAGLKGSGGNAAGVAILISQERFNQIDVVPRE